MRNCKKNYNKNLKMRTKLNRNDNANFMVHFANFK